MLPFIPDGNMDNYMLLFSPNPYLWPQRLVLILILLLIGSHVLAQAPTITSFSPASICQGESITITGTNFTGATAVRAGSDNAGSFTVNSPTSITAWVSDLAVNGQLSVTTPAGVVTGATLTVLPAPKPSLKHEGRGTNAPFTNCDGNSTYKLNVSNTSSTNGAGNVYEINWGDGSPLFSQTDWPSGAQTSHTYNSQGYFTIVMSIKPPNGCTKTKTYQFYNGKNPIASLTTSLSTTGLCAPASIEFQIGNWSNNSAGTTYEIDYGDGSPRITLQHPLSAAIHKISHQYVKSSCPDVDFKATLRAINGCFTTTYTLDQILIRKKPVADFTVPPSACINTPVCFTNETLNGSSGNNFCDASSEFLWDFGDGTTSTQENPPCHTYATAKTYTVTLTAFNTSCGSDTKTRQVIVTPISPVPVVVSPVGYCQGETAVALSAIGTGLKWYAPNGSVTTTAPVPATNRSGTFTWYVTQTLPNSCESPRVPITVNINFIPNAPNTSPVAFCQGQPAAPLTASGNNLLWYTDATTGTGSPTAPTPSTTNNGMTIYYVSQRNNGCEGPRAALPVTVNQLPGAPVVTSPVNYCQHQSPVPLTANGTGLLWYTTASGGTGSSTAITPSTAATGDKIYYVSQVTSCGEGPRAAITVHVNPGLSASIAYASAVICNASSTPVTVTLTGAAGGTYSAAPTGLSINASTGAINPAGARAGQYTITYSLRGTGGCSNINTTTTVTISSAPVATITYPALCTADGPTAVRLSGTAGGTYSSTAGLVIDAVTGTITPATSTPGDYVVTYVIAASTPCPGLTTTASVKITQAPSANISYSPASLCNINTPAVAVTLNGTLGGTYSSSPGLSINTVTGTINPSGATPGVYTIKYTVTGTGGCADYNTTTTVTVNGAPTATISYGELSYCGAITTPQRVILSGTRGGVFSSSAGLSINAVSGEINPSLSRPGNYIVTYTIAALAPCPGYSTTTNLRIDESPVITFGTSAQSICSGETAVFTPSSTVLNTTYNWSVTGPLPENVAGINTGTSSGAISLSFTNNGFVSQLIKVRVIPSNPSQPPCPGAAYDLELTVKPATPAPVTDTANFCMGMPPAALVVQGTNIKWYDNNLVLLNAAPVINTTIAAEFKYYVSQSNSFGCESPKSEIVGVVHPVAKIISADFLNPTTCGVPSGAIILNVLDLNDAAIPDIPVFVHYNKFLLPQIFSGSTDANGKITIPLTAGTYSNISVETSGGCTSQQIPDVFILKDPTPPEQPVAGYNPPLCSGTPLTLTALTATSTQAGPIDYVWAGPAFGLYADTVKTTVITFPSVASSDAGTYVVYAIQNNCISLPENFEVVISQSPSQPVISARTPLCVGDDLLLQAYSSIPGNASLEYLWKGPAAGFPVNTPNAAVNKVKIEDAGIYSVTVSSPETGCSATSDKLIEIGGYPIVKLGQDTISLPTGYRFIMNPVITNATDPGILPVESYTWTPSTDLSCNDALCSSPVVTIKNNTCYQLKVTNVYGCSGSDTLCVNVFCKSSQVFVPNAFAPGGNVPENKRLMVRATGISAVKSFRIYNRWGRIVFERSNFSPNSAEYGWDGMVNGKPADTGVYIYTVDVICENGVPYSFKGNVTLF